MRTSALRHIPELSSEELQAPGTAARPAADPIDVALLTGGTDRHYAYGLAMSLVTKGVRLDVVGGPGIDGPEMHDTPGLNFLDVWRTSQSGAGVLKKGTRLLANYSRLIAYAWKAKPEILHILWNSRIKLVDRVILMLYYKMLGKKIVLTAHNVNEARRDGRDSVMNRLSLKVQYRLADHLFVHTERMKDELVKEFGVAAEAVTVIPYGINNAVPNAGVPADEAKRRLGIQASERTILFFGNLRPSKGLEYLLAAIEQLQAEDPRYRLIVAGQRLRQHDDYWQRVQVMIRRLEASGSLILKSEFIPDEDVAWYFAAADVAALPYSDIFQSGVLFLAYSFGLPVVATDVGSLRDDIIEGRTGFLSRPRDVSSLAEAIRKYFESDLFRQLESRKREIREYAYRRHSWIDVAGITQAVYQNLALKNSSESQQPTLAA